MKNLNLRNMGQEDVKCIIRTAAKKATKKIEKRYIMLDDVYCKNPELITSTSGPNKPYNSRMFWGYVQCIGAGQIVYAEHFDDAGDEFLTFEELCDRLYTYISETY